MKSNIKSNKYSLGKAGEKIACEFILEKGFKILEKNYRFGKSGEIDIIAQKNETIVFVEVKSRSNSTYGGPLYSISNKKKNTIKKVANHYIVSNNLIENALLEYRYDLITLLDGQLEWIQDIFR